MLLNICKSGIPTHSAAFAGVCFLCVFSLLLSLNAQWSSGKEGNPWKQNVWGEEEKIKMFPQERKKKERSLILKAETKSEKNTGC